MFDTIAATITVMLQVAVVLMPPALLIIAMTFDDITK